MDKSLAETVADTQRRFLGFKALLYGYADKYGVEAVEAFLVLVCGLILSRVFARWAKNALDKKEIEPPVRLLILRLTRLSMLAVTLMITLETIGVKITSLFVGLSVAGVGVGLATQGVLSNIVAGLTIIFTKPFKVGDYIEMIGVSGQVDHIDLTTSRLVRGDLSLVIIPNRHIMGEVVHNFGRVRMMELNVGIGYAADLTAAMAVVREILGQNPRVLKTPAPFVGVSGLGESSINLTVKAWTGLGDFGAAQAEVYQEIARQFQARKIEIPFPQREVRLISAAPAGLGAR